MFESLLNSIFLKLWSGDKKVGPQKRILMSRNCETYSDTIYDLKWTLKYIHANGKTSHSVTITERASKWNLKRVIHRIEKHHLPKEIEALVRKNIQTN